MKKLLGIVVLGLLWCNYGNTEEPNLGVATIGFSCDQISVGSSDLGKAKFGKKKNIGFVKEDGFFFKLSFDGDLNEFSFPLEDTPIFIENIKDKDNSLSEVYFWYDLPVMNKKVIGIWTHNILYFDENTQKYFYFVRTYSLAENNKLIKIAKKKDKLFWMQDTDNINDKIFTKMQTGFLKNNKSIFKDLSSIYGSPISATKLKNLKIEKVASLYICEEI